MLRGSAPPRPARSRTTSSRARSCSRRTPPLGSFRPRTRSSPSPTPRSSPSARRSGCAPRCSATAGWTASSGSATSSSWATATPFSTTQAPPHSRRDLRASGIRRLPAAAGDESYFDARRGARAGSRGSYRRVGPLSALASTAAPRRPRRPSRSSAPRPSGSARGVPRPRPSTRAPAPAAGRSPSPLLAPARGHPPPHGRRQRQLHLRRWC